MITATDRIWSLCLYYKIAGNDYCETFFAKDTSFAIRYAEIILGGRFKKGEPSIAQNGYRSYEYARDVIGGRFEEGEEAIFEGRNSTYCWEEEYHQMLFNIGIII